MQCSTVHYHASSGNVYYFFKTSAPYKNTFVSYALPPQYARLFTDKELVVDTRHTFRDFLNIIIKHVSLIQKRKKQGDRRARQKIVFVFWEGKGMSVDERFTKAFESMIEVPRRYPEGVDVPPTYVIIDINDPGRMLYDSRVRYSADKPPRGWRRSATTNKENWWTTAPVYLGGYFKVKELVQLGGTAKKANELQISALEHSITVYMYVSNQNSQHCFDAVSVVGTGRRGAPGRVYSNYDDLIQDRLGLAAATHHAPKNQWTREAILQAVPDDDYMIFDGVYMGTYVSNVVPVPFETLVFLKCMCSGRQPDTSEQACMSGLKTYVDHYLGVKDQSDHRILDGIGTIVARNIADGDKIINAVRRINPRASRKEQWRFIKKKSGTNVRLLNNLDYLLLSGDQTIM